jgi:hypothetical protein
VFSLSLGERAGVRANLFLAQNHANEGIEALVSFGILDGRFGGFLFARHGPDQLIK